MLHSEKSEGLVDFHDVMDVVYRMTRIGMYHCTVHVLSHRPCVPKPRPLRHENQLGLLIFQHATLKNTERPGYEAMITEGMIRSKLVMAVYRVTTI